ncbi:MAG: hypothetical protein GF344_06075 [Chitinivibrionales bacterium]|nr:hypothetical protein [Chitinivibrionales bacterium]MBD3356508.1 hypothetical protein [Chitinivibrionales bacterium]
MTPRKRPVCGLDIGTQSITLTQCFPGESIITNISIQPLDTEGGDFWTAVNEGFSALVAGLRLGGADVVVSLPGEYSIIKRIALDNDEQDVEPALEWELGQHIIGAMEDYVFDFQRCAQQSHDDHRDFLVVGYRKTSVDRIVKLLRNHKLNPLIVDLDLFALINVHEINYADLIAEPTLVVHGDGGKSKLALTRQGDFFDSETAEYDADRISSEEYVASINDAAQKLVSCNTDFVDSPADLKIYVTGRLFSNAQFAEEVLKGLGNAEVLHPFKEVSCSAGMTEEDLNTYSPQLAVAVGLAMRGLDEVE